MRLKLREVDEVVLVVEQLYSRIVCVVTGLELGDGGEYLNVVVSDLDSGWVVKVCGHVSCHSGYGLVALKLLEIAILWKDYSVLFEECFLLGL